MILVFAFVACVMSDVGHSPWPGVVVMACYAAMECFEMWVKRKRA